MHARPVGLTSRALVIALVVSALSMLSWTVEPPLAPRPRASPRHRPWRHLRGRRTSSSTTWTTCATRCRARWTHSASCPRPRPGWRTGAGTPTHRRCPQLLSVEGGADDRPLSAQQRRAEAEPGTAVRRRTPSPATCRRVATRPTSPASSSPPPRTTVPPCYTHSTVWGRVHRCRREGRRRLADRQRLLHDLSRQPGPQLHHRSPRRRPDVLPLRATTGTPLGTGPARRRPGPTCRTRNPRTPPRRWELRRTSRGGPQRQAGLRPAHQRDDG